MMFMRCAASRRLCPTSSPLDILRPAAADKPHLASIAQASDIQAPLQDVRVVVNEATPCFIEAELQYLHNTTRPSGS
eukprot:8032178-Heterocapsa_arctica.AAC.1